MVGGIIVEAVRVSDEKAWLNCVDRSYPKEECAIYVKPAGHDIRVGDALWWQGSSAMWTPRIFGTTEHDPSRGEVETVLERIGYSGVPRPEGAYR